MKPAFRALNIISQILGLDLVSPIAYKTSHRGVLQASQSLYILCLSLTDLSRFNSVASIAMKQNGKGLHCKNVVIWPHFIHSWK